MPSGHHDSYDRVVSEFSDVAAHLWRRGWAEAHAGNISARIDLPGNRLPDGYDAGVEISLPRAYPPLAGAFLLLTGSGRRMRDVGAMPRAHTGILRVDAESAKGRFFLHDESSHRAFRPTSELAAHLAAHEMFAREGGKEQVLLHTHPPELIALTHHPHFRNEESISRTLWSMLPEVFLLLPEGIGFIPYLRTGSEELARATAESFRTHRILLWEKHGVLATGPALPEAFDAIDIAVKGAAVYLLCKQAGFEPEGLTPAQIAELRSLLS